VPIGFFLSCARSIITIYLNRRLNWDLTKDALIWISANRKRVEEMYQDVIHKNDLRQRLDLLCRLCLTPQTFLEEANIQYWAPADAAKTGLSDHSVDIHFSVTTLEHIPLPALRSIFVEASRVLTDDGAAIHFVDPSDHFQHQDPAISKINLLRFSDTEWERIAGNPFAYCNRLRMSDYLKSFQSLSFGTERLEHEVDRASLNVLASGFPLDAKFSEYTAEDICTTYFKIMIAKRH